MTLGAERFDCGPHILTSPESKNKSIELHVKTSDFNVELVRSKDKINLFLCCDNIHRLYFPKRHWIPWSILSFPVKQHSFISLQALGSMMASDSSELHCEGQEYQTESKWHRECCIFFLISFYIKTMQSFQRFLKYWKGCKYVNSCFMGCFG